MHVLLAPYSYTHMGSSHGSSMFPSLAWQDEEHPFLVFLSSESVRKVAGGKCHILASFLAQDSGLC